MAMLGDHFTVAFIERWSLNKGLNIFITQHTFGTLQSGPLNTGGH